MTAPGEPSAAVVRAQRALARAELVSLDPRQGPLLRAICVGVRVGFALVGWRVRAEGPGRLPRDGAGPRRRRTERPDPRRRRRPLPGLRRLFR